LLFELSRPLDDLEGMLLAEFGGQALSVRDIYEQHSVGKRYISKNYKDILMRLEAQGRIIANPPADERRKNTLADHVMIAFRQEGKT